ncbi:MAG: ATP-binding protein [Bacteroidia bacterium]|nr:ATP-binding protein [Bacteroidia bacterium]
MIRSIAEQGYSLETAIADLIDNSLSAGSNRIEILTAHQNNPFSLFIADNGNGMDEHALRENLRFPSQSSENARDKVDLGRFGLGLKTASFSQTRKFTVISRKKGKIKYAARTWDVNYLSKVKEWRIIVNSEAEIENLLEQYQTLRSNYQKEFVNFSPNTIIVWQGLYKFDSHYKNFTEKAESLSHELSKVTAFHLGLAFHRFLEKEDQGLKIRLNNIHVKSFNPFPIDSQGLRAISPIQGRINDEPVRLEGFVLPASAMEKSDLQRTIWTYDTKGLFELAGMYFYRADRLIYYGGWNGIIRKSRQLQLARLKVDVGNNVDHLFHLNVSKSQISIPHQLRDVFKEYILMLKGEAEKEYYNRTLRNISGSKKKDVPDLLERVSTNKGVILQVNKDFQLLEDLKSELSNGQFVKVKTVVRMLVNRINKIRGYSQEDYLKIENDKTLVNEDELEEMIIGLLEQNVPSEFIKNKILGELGHPYTSLSPKIKNILNPK